MYLTVPIYFLHMHERFDDDEKTWIFTTLHVYELVYESLQKYYY